MSQSPETMNQSNQAQSMDETIEQLKKAKEMLESSSSSDDSEDEKASLDEKALLSLIDCLLKVCSHVRLSGRAFLSVANSLHKIANLSSPKSKKRVAIEGILSVQLASLGMLGFETIGSDEWEGSELDLSCQRVLEKLPANSKRPHKTIVKFESYGLKLNGLMISPAEVVAAIDKATPKENENNDNDSD